MAHITYEIYPILCYYVRVINVNVLQSSSFSRSSGYGVLRRAGEKVLGRRDVQEIHDRGEHQLDLAGQEFCTESDTGFCLHTISQAGGSLMTFCQKNQ